MPSGRASPVIFSCSSLSIYSVNCRQSYNIYYKYNKRKQFDSKQIRSTSVLSSSDIQEDVTKLHIRKKYYKDTETNRCEESMIQVWIGYYGTQYPSILL